MAADEREWLERLVAVAERALADLRELDDPTNQRLLADLEAFRGQLLWRLGEEPSGDP